jgi:hypothetical protein
MDSTRHGFDQAWIRSSMDSTRHGFDQAWIRPWPDACRAWIRIRASLQRCRNVVASIAPSGAAGKSTGNASSTVEEQRFSPRALPTYQLLRTRYSSSQTQLLSSSEPSGPPPPASAPDTADHETTGPPPVSSSLQLATPPPTYPAQCGDVPVWSGHSCPLAFDFDLSRTRFLRFAERLCPMSRFLCETWDSTVPSSRDSGNPNRTPNQTPTPCHAERSRIIQRTNLRSSFTRQRK